MRQQLLAAAQSQRAAGRRMQALALCGDLLQRWPNDAQALQLQVRLLSELGAAAQAMQLARQLDPPLPAQEMADLEADLATHQTRWASAMPADSRHPYIEADHAVDTMDDTLARYGEHFPEVAARARVDRLVSYDRASRSAAAVSEYQSMLQAGKPLPWYADEPVADALLQQRQPEQAMALYEDSIKHEPGPYPDDQVDPHIGLMYAHVEAGHYRQAVASIDQTAAAEPAWRPIHGSTVPVINPHKIDADISAALIRKDAWLYRDAWQRIDAMLAQAPMNSMLWREMADVERARGWPRRSERSAITAAGIDPDDARVRLSAIEDWRELNDFSRVEPSLQDVEAVIPRDKHVLLTRDAWDRQRGWQFDFEHDRGQGGAPNFGDYDHETQAKLQSPLLDDHWRIYGLTRLAGASLQEGHTERDRLGLGVIGYARGLEAYVQVLPGLGSRTSRTAVEAGVKWFPSDYLTFNADWSSSGDQDVPLRANYYGITAHSLDVQVQWRASELTSAKLSASRDLFSDNNQRNGWQAEVIQRLHTSPYLSLDGGVQVGSSRNSRSDVPYFSPQQARWGLLTGRLENMLSQRYERTWQQRIDIAAGVYQERHFGSSWMFSTRYGQTFTPRGGLAFGWGLSWGSQPYDGRRSARVMLDLTMHWGA
ncbi:poly-beta-1,6 N-acetyl-D-glucosamine export porin PgaA [Dyella silvatica]|uniref:poly-beta-1,6 N-acetyl-D-glucosamine export porin PgaA n=1 Tax=Dyella silvatica TaxID=2992128 RepID=UPI002251F047|nr:poly-beta-1,6 N-acetyl-D-glucosamine export porin PgaA [Dyella silvatica]